MTTPLAVGCLTCGTVSVNRSDLTVTVSPDTPHRLSFTCPGCRQWQSREISGAMAATLANLGVELRIIPPPVEPQPRCPTPLDEDEFFRLIRWLAEHTDDIIDRAVEA